MSIAIKSVAAKGFRTWRNRCELVSYVFFLGGYLGSTFYLLLMGGLLATKVELLGAAAIFMGFAFPLFLLAGIGSLIIGSVVGLVSLKVWPTTLALITYAIWQGKLHYLQYPFSFVGYLTGANKQEEDFSTFIYVNVLVVLVCALWLFKSRKRVHP